MKYFALGALSLAISGCSSEQSYDSSAQLANAIKLQYQVVSNHPNSTIDCADLGAEWATCNQFNILLRNDDNGVIKSNWTLYIHSVRRLLDIQTDQLNVEHITGDLYRLTPSDQFTSIEPGEVLTVPVIGEFFEVAKSDFIPRAFVVDEGGNATNLKWSDTEDLNQLVLDIDANDLKRTPTDQSVITSAEQRYQDNSVISTTENSRVFPTPKHTSLNQESIDVSSGFKFEHLEQSPRSTDVIIERIESLGLSAQGTLPIIATVNPYAFDEDNRINGAYQLSIHSDGIGIVGYDDSAIFYAFTTLLDLVEGGQLRTGTIEDAPRFDYRGVMIDIARNFHTKDYLLDLLDEMSRSKMNKLAIHMSDDEGWRLEIPGLPELTEIGAQRCFDLDERTCLLPQLGSGANSDNFGSGYLTREDFIQLLVAADARHIEVIPELDMPAHARAAVVSMEARYHSLAEQGLHEAANQYRLVDPNDESNVTTVQYYDRRSFINPCLDSSIAFTAKVIDEVAAMYESAGLPLTTWHFGGDEAKNIKLGAGFQDITETSPVDFKGLIDQSREDYPFEKSPACQSLVESGVVSGFEALPSYWAQQVSELAADSGFTSFQAWEDGLKYVASSEDMATENVRVNFWETLSADGDENAYKWSNNNYDVIISVPDYLYFDFPQAIDQYERGFYWATRANPMKKVFAFAPENLPQNASYSVNRDGEGFVASSNEPLANFHGMSVQLWSEVVRNDAQAEYMIYPRIYAAAERAWATGAWETEYTPGASYSLNDGQTDLSEIDVAWSGFVATLGYSILPRLEDKSIEYRLPLAGAIIESNQLLMNSSIPALSLEYSLDGGSTWATYLAPVPVQSNHELVRVRTASSSRKGRSTPL